MEHRGRRAHAAHSERQHADHPRRDAEPAAVVARLQPVRAQPGHLRPDGGPHAALPPCLLPRRERQQGQVALFDALHPHHTGVSGLHLQHYCDSCRQVSRNFTPS